jgi:hypothetical protein
MKKNKLNDQIDSLLNDNDNEKPENKISDNPNKISDNPNKIDLEEALKGMLEEVPELNQNVSRETSTEISPHTGKPKRQYKKRNLGNQSSENSVNDEQLKAILDLSMSYALISLSQIVSMLIKDEKWKITNQTEADQLGKIIVVYLNQRFPNWTNISPEINLIMGLSTYFVPRLGLLK